MTTVCTKCSQHICNEIDRLIEVNIVEFNNLYQKTKQYNLRSNVENYKKLLIILNRLFTANFFLYYDKTIFVYDEDLSDYENKELYFNTFRCDSCLAEKENFIESTFYVESIIFTKIYNTMMEMYLFMKKIDINIEEYTNMFNSIKNKLIEMEIDINYRPLCHLWKGRHYYFEMLFEIPIQLYLINIPIEHYKLRKNTYFSDMICGHPFASNGWCQDGWDDCLENNLIK